jgi:hypothetical protein
MKTTGFLLLMLLIVLPALSLRNEGNPDDKDLLLDFEAVTTGKLPDGWKVEATNQRGPLATWEVTEEKKTPSGMKALSLTRTNHTSGSTFNLCWTDRTSFLNGEISVMVRANEGEEDQGGGVIWRARDKSDYYIARYNPLEDNFRIYYVKDGDRRMLASARLHIPAHKWFELKITMEGEIIKGYLNGKKYLEVKDDTFKNAGGVGLWIKADGKTSFDDFSVIGK